MTAKMALDGIRVVCFGMGGAAPLATATLGDFGAEIFKIEPRTGGWSRTTPGLGTREFNRNKKGIAIDLKYPQGVALAKRLIATADVMMESFRPGVMERLGLGYEAIKAINPRIVYCSLSAYGQTGPWKDRPGVDGIVQAVSGIMSVVGPDVEGGATDDPIKVSFPVVDMTGGLMAVQGIMMALFARERHAGSGLGQHVDVSLLEGALVIQKSSLTRYLSSRKLPVKTGSRAPYATPNEAYKTKDGHIMLAAYTDTRWHALCCNVLQHPELESDPRFKERPTRQHHHRGVSRRQLRRARHAAQRLVGSAAVHVMVGVARQFEEQRAAHAMVAVPGVVGAHGLEPAGGVMAATQAVVLDVVDHLEQRGTVQGLHSQEQQHHGSEGHGQPGVEHHRHPPGLQQIGRAHV